MKNNVEGASARAAVTGISSRNPFAPRRRFISLDLKSPKKEKPAKPKKVTSERVKDERVKEPPINVRSERVDRDEQRDSGPINVRSERINSPEPRAISAPTQKPKSSKPRKPRDVKYTQPPLPGMRNTRQFKGKNGDS